MTTSTASLPHRTMPGLIVATIGVVYGDIGTSPLYTLREVFTGGYGVRPDEAGVLGILSLIFWSLLWVVSLKYVIVVLRADNEGEGGVMALTALARQAVSHHGVREGLILLGLVGAALLYGDSMITPAISVLSAVEGVEVAYPAIDHWIVPVALIILIGLFVLQHKGTTVIGRLFGPLMLVWFTSLAALGLMAILQTPEVLLALNPGYAVGFFTAHPGIGIAILSAVVLALTGAEALYADLGHFGRPPIARAWFLVVLPALLLNYFGQGALLLEQPEAIRNPFYLLAPEWALWPLVVLATLATIIASQAVISGAFSITYQAIRFGYLPRMSVHHTSRLERGQIYMPLVNWLLMAGVVALVVGFASSTGLATAYGIAVTGTMLITTLLLGVVMLRVWHWPGWLAIPLLIGFVLVDTLYFSANIAKLFHGGAFPVLAGAGLFLLMSTWRRGRRLLEARQMQPGLSLEGLITSLQRDPPHRVEGTAIFLSGRTDILPRALLHNLMHNQVLHRQVALLTVVTEDRPFVPISERAECQSFEFGFYRIVLHFGFMEYTDVPGALRYCHCPGLTFEPLRTTWFLTRETLIANKRMGMARWRERLFSFMLKNAQSNMQYFHLPPHRVVELGSQLEV
ncbi:potassium transporter Kup [Kushneria phosphatilytica]|nr:potassium transporter Kup [Kushneria phosphatilytica]OHV07821.1 potassium transporter Kup [Kushneria phosphatilytica]